ncbi:ice-binding family protein [Rhodoferax ferrireducens]|uniref:ice-binding family protein n=1 Tax=Rhodoferax ferrireducens TaxID=192843 RepID=UPI0018E4EEA4|nr:ice-binding family protein [Rhodoferax ferrireducens]
MITSDPTGGNQFVATSTTGVASNGKLISATFSLAMNAATINAATFTLAPLGGALLVPATVSYDAATKVATLTTSSALVASTSYTAVIHAGATSATGTPVGCPFAWTFKTATVAVASPAVIGLGSASTFGTFGGTAGITNAGLLTVVNGDIGTTAVSTAVTGFHDAGPGCTYTETTLNRGTVNGLIYTAAPPPTVACPTEGTATTFAIATQARADALAAYNALAAMPVGANPGANLAGLTLAPGVYTAPNGSFMMQGGDLTLDAQGDANAVWVFQMATTLTVGGPGAAAPQSVILTGGAQAKNVFWQVGSAATINAGGGGTMVGTIIAQAGAAFSTAGNVAIVTLQGRALSLGASVTLVNTVVNVPQ